MRAVLIVVLFIAVAAAGGAAWLVNTYLAQQREQAEAQEEPELPAFRGLKVLVADRPIGPGEPLGSGMFRWQPWPDQDVLPEYKVIGSTEGSTKDELFNQRTIIEDAMSGKIARRPIAAGEPITDLTVFRRDNASFMAGALQPGMRAVSMPVNATTGASGFILPGDRVDVILTHDIRDSLPGDLQSGGPDSPVSRYVAETILEALRVLAIDQSIRTEEGKAKVVDTVTVEVTAGQAEVINLARRMGSMSLSLRALSDRQAPVGLAALLGMEPVDKTQDRPLVSDRSVSKGLEMLLRAAAESRLPPPSPEPEMADPWPEPEPMPAAEPEPAWSVTVYRGTSERTVYEGEPSGAVTSSGGNPAESPAEDPSAADRGGFSGRGMARSGDAGAPVGITPEMADEIPIAQ